MKEGGWRGFPKLQVLYEEDRVWNKNEAFPKYRSGMDKGKVEIRGIWNEVTSCMENADRV